MKTALIVAFHFPPFGSGSGILRILKFCRFLPEFAWQPVVLTANDRAYERIDLTLLREIPSDVPVFRAFALDAQKHLSVKGRYLRWMAIPDRWASWLPAAIMVGVRLIRKKRIDVIVTTYPVASAVLIGLVLHKLTGRPWVVDFRDSMTEEEYPRDPLIRQVCRWIEKKAVQHAGRLIFTAQSTIAMYLKRYPWLSAQKCLLIPNGYDEEDFESLLLPQPAKNDSRCIRLLHLGVIYPFERDPRPFFRAIARLKKQGRINAAELKIALRASGSETYYSQILQELGINDMVQLLPPIPYPEALREAASSDGLLLLQAGNCDHQIPAKAYEYLRLQRPILALTTQTGDTAGLLRETGGASIIDLADEDAIYRDLPDFLTAVRTGRHQTADLKRVRRYARRNQAAMLAQSLTELVEIEGGTWTRNPRPVVEPES
jgi:glycosyltransferase involved in cell wall biosynthesis